MAGQFNFFGQFCYHQNFINVNIILYFPPEDFKVNAFRCCKFKIRRIKFFGKCYFHRNLTFHQILHLKRYKNNLHAIQNNRQIRPSLHCVYVFHCESQTYLTTKCTIAGSIVQCQQKPFVYTCIQFVPRRVEDFDNTPGQYERLSKRPQTGAMELILFNVCQNNFRPPQGPRLTRTYVQTLSKYIDNL